MSQHQLVDSSVFDRSGYLIGKVVRVEALPAGDFSLVVRLVGENLPDNDVIIENSYIHDLDSANKIVHVDIDHQEFSPDAGQGIQLLEERLVVNRKRVKVGEVSIRRVVETEIVEVPVQREKLVIEKIGTGEPPIEVALGETHLQGYDRSSSPKSVNDEPEAAATGSFDSIQDAINFLKIVADGVENACEKVRAGLFLNGNTGLRGTVYDFETPQVAIEKLSRLEKILLNQCNSVRLDLFMSDSETLKIYRDLIAQHSLS